MGHLRYDGPRPAGNRPSVVVWNVTRGCNLRCLHCYANARTTRDPDELTAEEGEAFMDDLAAYGVPVLILSGGEPLVRPDLLDLAAYGVSRGLRMVVSTNGTLLTEDAVAGLRDVGVAYVGVSVDGEEGHHDRLRGVQGAFRQTLDGIRRCRDAGLRVGLRFTVTQYNADALPGVLELARRERIPRLCVYHLVYAGRGARLREGDLPAQDRRLLVFYLLREAERTVAAGEDRELLTVDNHADAAFACLYLLGKDQDLAAQAWRRLEANGGNRSGHRIGAVDPQGGIHPDPFWSHYTVGNVRERPFSALWEDPEDVLLQKLRDRRPYLKGRCRTCRFFRLCNGNMRVRAEAATGDVWGDDPSCYLRDGEIQGEVPLAA